MSRVQRQGRKRGRPQLHPVRQVSFDPRVQDPGSTLPEPGELCADPAFRIACTICDLVDDARDEGRDLPALFVPGVSNGALEQPYFWDDPREKALECPTHHHCGEKTCH